MPVPGEVAPAPGSFDGRNRKSLSRMSTTLAAWNRDGRPAEAARVAAPSRDLWDRLPARAPERTRCGELMNVGAPMAKSVAKTG